jgi:hypothetical protein
MTRKVLDAARRHLATAGRTPRQNVVNRSPPRM